MKIVKRLCIISIISLISINLFGQNVIYRSYLGLGYAYAQKRDYDESNKYYRMSMRQYPRLEYNTLVHLARNEMFFNNLHNADTYYDKYENRYKYNLQAVKNEHLAQNYNAHNKFFKAYEHFNRASKFDPNESYYLYQKAKLKQIMREHDQAIVYYNRYINRYAYNKDIEDEKQRSTQYFDKWEITNQAINKMFYGDIKPMDHNAHTFKNDIRYRFTHKLGLGFTFRKKLIEYSTYEDGDISYVGLIGYFNNPPHFFGELEIENDNETNKTKPRNAKAVFILPDTGNIS
ncbi:tetratricopeptide repeat protein [Candidatus Margulisiibacteriota bacterium]